MVTKQAIKLAGPDSRDNYKVISTKCTLLVRPGEIHTEDFIKRRLFNIRDLEVTIIEPKFDKGIVKTFIGEVVS